jgi:hypothetical protein
MELNDELRQMIMIRWQAHGNRATQGMRNLREDLDRSSPPPLK